MPAPDDQTPRPGRLGMLVDGRFVFTCASCGRVAATLAVHEAGAQIDGGPLPDHGRLTWSPGGPSFVLDFLGIVSGLLPAELIGMLIGAESADPLEIARIDGDLGGFCCRACERNYCADCWSAWIEFDESFYDCTRGQCPRGHVQTLDD